MKEFLKPNKVKIIITIILVLVLVFLPLIPVVSTFWIALGPNGEEGGSETITHMTSLIQRINYSNVDNDLVIALSFIIIFILVSYLLSSSIYFVYKKKFKKY